MGSSCSLKCQLNTIFAAFPAVSPYLKSLSMVAANKLLHLLEAFSTTWFLFSAAQNHHLVFFLLEAFNNIIQYQFDGESQLVQGAFVPRFRLKDLNLCSSQHQETVTWFTQSFVKGTSSTSWPTCPPMLPPSRKLCSERGRHLMSYPARAPRRRCPWRDPIQLCQQNLAH